MEQNLLRRIERFLEESAMPPSVFGRDAVRDPRLVGDLRSGRIPGRDIICRSEHFMNKWRSDHHAGLVMPRGDLRTRAARRTYEEVGA